jgi:HlyD family secretion protein
MIEVLSLWRRRMTRRHLIMACVAVVVCVAGLCSVYTYRCLAALPELRTVEVQNRDLRITIGATGTVEPAQVVEVGPLVSGNIVGFGGDPADSTKPLQVGARVAKGTVLARIDPQPYEVALRKAEAEERVSAAEVGRLETQLQQASAELQRAQRLRNTNSQSEFDKIATAYESARAELAISKARREQALAEVQHAQMNLDRTVIHAPIEGIVIDSRVNLGQNVSLANSGLFLLAPNLDNMQIRASVSETDIGKIHRGQSVSFSVDAHRKQVLRDMSTAFC